MEPMNYVEEAAESLADILKKDPQNFAIIASGELSHCLEENSLGAIMKPVRNSTRQWLIL